MNDELPGSRSATKSYSLGGNTPNGRSQPTIAYTEPVAEGVGNVVEGSLGRFGLRAELGRGGHGVVYKAWDRHLHRLVAVKVLLADAHPHSTRADRFIREAHLAGRLAHPGIVVVYDMGVTDNGSSWYAMEYVPGPSLSSLLEDSGALPAVEAARILLEICEAIEHLHRAGYAHRDLKPANVVMTASGQPKLIDFGIAAILDDVESRLTRTGQLLGTPAYMPPEQRHCEPHDPQVADLWALGVMLCELATGQRPDHAKLPESLPEPLAVIARSALQADPSDRYPRVAAFADDLDRFLHGVAPQGQRPRSSWAKHRGRVATGAALVGLLGGMAAWASTDLRLNHAAATRFERVQSEADRLAKMGRPQESEDLLQGFVEDARNHRTHAEGRAWLAIGSMEREPAQARLGLEALGRAYVRGDRRTRGESMVTLVHQLASLHRYDDAEQALRIVDDSYPWRRVSERRELERTLALARWDFHGATGDDALGAAAAHLAAATDLGVGLGKLVHSRGHLAAKREGTDDWVAVSRVPRGGLRIEEAGSLVSDYEGEWPDGPLVFRTRGAQTQAVVLGTPHSTVVADLPTRQHMVRWAQTAERVVGATGLYERRLFELATDGHAVTQPHGPTQALQSYLTSAVAADLDGDGVDELALGIGPPAGFEIRVFEQGDRGLDLIATKRLGYLGEGSAFVHRDHGTVIAVAMTHVHPSKDMFPDGDHFGGDLGVYLIGLRGGSLEVLDRLDPSGHDFVHANVVGVGDVDDNGLQDILTTQGRGDATQAWSVLYLQTQHGFERMVLPDLEVLGSVQADDDDADEVLIFDRTAGTTWLLGHGDDTIRARSTPPATRSMGNTQIARSAQLATLGLSDEAASQLAQAAAIQSGREALEARRAAARLWTSLGRHGLAANQWQLAATSGLASDLRNARDAWIAQGRPERALEPAREVAALSEADHARWTWVRGIAGDATMGTTLDFSTTPEPALSARYPGLVQRSAHEETMRIQTLTGVGTVAELPLRRTAGPARLRFELDLSLLEWGSSIQLALEPVHSELGEPFGVVITGLGGGGLLFRQVNPGPLLDEAYDGPLDGTQLAVDVQQLQDGHLGYALYRDGSLLGQYRSSDPIALPAGRWRFVVRSHGQPGMTANSGVVQLSSIDIRGFETTPHTGSLEPPTQAWEDRIEMRRHPESSRLWNLGASAYYQLASDTWLSPAAMHTDAPYVADVLVRRVRLGPAALQDAVGRELLAWKVVALVELGDLNRAEIIAEDLLARPGRSDSTQRVMEYVVLAEVHSAAGRDDSALAEAGRALSAAGDRTVAQALFRRMPHLSRTTDDPRWRSVWSEGHVAAAHH